MLLTSPLADISFGGGSFIQQNHPHGDRSIWDKVVKETTHCIQEGEDKVYCTHSSSTVGTNWHICTYTVHRRRFLFILTIQDILDKTRACRPVKPQLPYGAQWSISLTSYYSKPQDLFEIEKLTDPASVPIANNNQNLKWWKSTFYYLSPINTWCLFVRVINVLRTLHEMRLLHRQQWYSAAAGVNVCLTSCNQMGKNNCERGQTNIALQQVQPWSYYFPWGRMLQTGNERYH